MSKGNKKSRGYIFRCSNSTEDECFKRMLFGEKPRYKSMVEQVIKGDILFLYNVTSGRLYGEFIATSKGKKNINPKAWGGEFPWQVRIKWNTKKKYNPILREDFGKIISFRKSYMWRYPEPILTLSQIKSLEKIFKGTQLLPSEEQQFREEFPAKYRADDGHLVRSLGELNIDNWLFNQAISHGYERKLPITETLYCDFYIQSKDKKGYVYIEYWGLEDDKYLRRKKQKLFIYKKHKLPLIEFVPKELENLDDIMPRKLRSYLKDHRFY